MKLFLALLALLISLPSAWAQAPENSPSSTQLDALTRKVDEINTKLDALSQQLLKVEQQNSRPGVMIGETTPSSPGGGAAAAPALPGVSAAATAGGNTHVVAKGETLTSIAKQTKVSVEDLQKFNHIEDGRKLQAGQTILIPSPGTSPGSSPAVSASP